MEHKHIVYDTDTHFLIDPITRAVKNATSKKVTLIQHDHNSERFTFDCPRYIEGHDMAECNKVEVHFLNIDAKTQEKKTGLYETTDLQISTDDESIVSCSWLISINATQLVGSLNFIIRYICEENGIVSYAWNTGVNSDIVISSGINSAELFTTEYVDIIEQWKESVMQTFREDLTAWKDQTETEMETDLAEWKKAESDEVHKVMGDYETYMTKQLDVERKRIDKIVKLPAGSTTGDAELLDIRIGADGVEYDSAGSAVRAQFNNALHGIERNFEYTVTESATYAHNIAIENGVRYRIVALFDDNVSNLDIGYTRKDGTDVLLFDNAISGHEYEFTAENAGTRFRFWTYLKESAETTVYANLSAVGTIQRAAQSEKSLEEINAALYGYKARVTKEGFNIAIGYALQAFYTIKPGKKFYLRFDTFDYSAVDRLNIYCNNADGNEIFHDSITPEIGKLYECQTSKENSNLILYLTPTATGGDIDFYVSIFEDGWAGENILRNSGNIEALKAADIEQTDKTKTLYNALGIPLQSEYSKTMSGVVAWDIEMPTEDGKQYIFTAESYTGQYYSEIQLYLFNSMSDYKTVKGGVQIGDTVIFDGNSAYKYFRVYAMTTNTEAQPETLTVKIGEYYGNALLRKVDTLTDTIYKRKTAPNVLVLGDSYSQMGFWFDQLRGLVNLGDIVNLGVSSASLKDKYTDRVKYPYDSRPVSNDTRGGNVNTFGSQVEKLKRLMLGNDLDSGEKKLYENSAPDIILIEGGTNDPVDSSTDGYVSQIYTVERAYIARRSDTAPHLGYIKKPTPYTETNRTTFAGAMRYLYGILHEMFPNALMFYITPCGLTYMSGGEHPYLEKGNQIKYAASLLGIPVIDWGVNGRLSVCDNVVTGSGTAADPYIYDVAGEYSADSLHPNRKGALFLAMEVAKVLREYGLAGPVK